MNTEISAGGIIITKTNNVWYVLLIKDRSGTWTFPKGKIEDGEELLETATREIAEEVGIKHITLIAELPPITYWYTRVKNIHKTVHYFIFKTEKMHHLIPQKEEGITEAKWVEFLQVADIIGYPQTNKPLLLSVQKYL